MLTNTKILIHAPKYAQIHTILISVNTFVQQEVMDVLDKKGGNLASQGLIINKLI